MRCDKTERQEMTRETQNCVKALFGSSSSQWSHNMEIPSLVLFHVFSLLDTDKLLSISRVCFKWWTIVFKGPFLRNAELFELDLGGMGDLYRFVPLKLFANLTRLTLSSTEVTNSHLQQIVSKASELEYLDISNCLRLDKTCIFQGKSAVGWSTWTFLVTATSLPYWWWHVCAHVKVYKLLSHMDMTFPQTNCCFF